MTAKRNQSHLFNDVDINGQFSLGGTAVAATAAELDAAATLADDLSATQTEIDRVADVSARLVAAGSTLSVTEALHDGKIVALDTLAGSVCTLPAAVGTGAKFKFLVTAEPSTNAHIIQVAAGTDDEFIGQVSQIDTDTSDTQTVQAAQAADDFDTITMNATTQGGEVGDWVEVVDIAAGVWAIEGRLKHTGNVAVAMSDESITS